MALTFKTSQIRDAAITNDKLAGSIAYSKLVLTGAILNADLAGSIANAKLANSSVSYGGVSLSLGGSDATPAFDLADATNYPTSSLVGTITNAQLAGSIANGKLTNSYNTVSDGSNTTAVALGGTVTYAAGEGLDVAESSGTITFSAEDATDSNKGVASFDSADFSVTSGAVGIKALGVSNAQLAGSIANGKLANSSVAFGGVTLSLGGSDATPAFDLTDATNYPTSSLTGTITNAQLAGSIAFDKLADSANIARLDQGETVAGTWAFSNLPTAAANPSADNQLARKAYVDSVAQGLDVKDSVKAATTANITLSGTQTIDGISMLADDRILVKDQSSGAENGIYVVAGGAWSRSTDFAAGDDEAGAFCFVEQGTVNADSGWVCTNNKGSATVGTHALTFSQFSGVGQITAGDGLGKSGNTLSVNVDNSSIEISSDALRVKASGIVTSMIAADAIDASKIAENAVTASELANNAVDTGAVSNNAITLAKIGFTPVSQIATMSDSSTSEINLTNQITEADFRNGAWVQVFVNGQKLYYVSGGGSDNSEYTVSDNGSVTKVVFGAALDNADKVEIDYCY